MKRASITLDIEKGDTLLGGRFKNHKVVVKDIGTDDLGQPTVNGMKLLSFRIAKKMPKEASVPSTTEKQRRFFGAVMGAKKGKKGASGEAKSVAKDMSKEQISHYLKKAVADGAAMYKRASLPMALLQGTARSSGLGAVPGALIGALGGGLSSDSTAGRGALTGAATGAGAGIGVMGLLASAFIKNPKLGGLAGLAALLGAPTAAYQLAKHRPPPPTYLEQILEQLGLRKQSVAMLLKSAGLGAVAGGVLDETLAMSGTGTSSTATLKPKSKEPVIAKPGTGSVRSDWGPYIAQFPHGPKRTAARDEAKATRLWQ